MVNIEVESLSEFKNHKNISFFYDAKTGLKGFIAIHNTNLGPATGGTRYWEYPATKDAFRDVLKLSSAMTYKCALAGAPFGGGKGVIIKNGKTVKTRAFLHAYANIVNLFGGNFSTGEDVGMNEKDIEILAEKSDFIIGRKGKAGDPSPWAALGVFHGIKSGLKEIFGNGEIQGRTFSVKGLGKVGFELCRLLYKEGGNIIAADINPAVLKKAAKKFPKIKIINPFLIHKEKADVYSPCALGEDLNKKTIRELKCGIVCGSANNQLFSSENGRELYKRNILYIPDYVANAGGLINVTAELDGGGYDRDRVLQKVKNIGNTVAKIIKLSSKLRKPTNFIADEMAEKIFMKKKGD